MNAWSPLVAIFCTFALILAGCMDQPDPEETQEATMAPGSTASLPVVVRDAPWDPETVTVDVQESAGLEVTTTQWHDTGNDTISGWVSFTAEDGLEEGDHDVRIEVSSGDGDTRAFHYLLSVETPETRIEEGEQATIHATGRTEDGELVFTTQTEIADAPLPHAEAYQPPPQTEPIPLSVAYNGQLPDEIVDALLGGGDGHTMTVAVDDFFGPEMMEEVHQREEEIQRSDLQQRQYEFPRQQAEQQGIIASDAEEGDEIDLPSLPFPYAIEEFREDPEQGELVVIVAQVEGGDRVTLHEQWPEAAEVTEITEDSVHLYLHPPYEEGERFTWVDGWEDATEISHVDDDLIVLRHSPEVGLTYERPGQQSGATVEATVVEVGDENITISEENPDPLGGETIFLELTIIAVGEAEERNADAPE